MVRIVTREAVRDLVTDRRAQLVEVLPGEEYERAHLPGAVSVPMGDLGEPRTAALERSRPVVVYCRDWLCDLSPRAARRLERLGFAEVYDYSAGKSDWISAGLPWEGKAVLAGGRMRRDPVVARPEDPLEQVADRILADPAGLAVVADEDDVVHGVIGARELEGADPAATAERAMRTDVTTARPSDEARSLTERMERAGLRHVVVTRPDGTLAGLFGLGDLREPEWEPDLG